MKPTLLLILLLTIYLAGYAQGKTAAIRGIITDSVSGDMLEWASVSLLRVKDSTVILQQLSGKHGFYFHPVLPGDYKVVVSHTRYHPATLRIAITGTDTLYHLGDIGLTVSATNLLEVVVRSVIPPVIVKNDTLVYNTHTVTTEPNATIEDLLKKLPGFEVDKNGSILLNGQKIEKIYIDGKEFFLNDPRQATQYLTADMIEAIEAFDNQTEKALLTGIKDIYPNKALNLRLKKDRKKGLFGNIRGGTGLPDNYSAGATATYFNGNRWAFGNTAISHTGNNLSAGGLKQSAVNNALNYRDQIGQKTQLVVNYSNDMNHNQSGQLYKRETFTGDSSLVQSKDAINSARSVIHQFSLTLAHTIDSFSTLVFAPSLSLQQSRSANADTSFVVSQKNRVAHLINEGRTENFTSADGTGFSNTITYKRKFKKQARSLFASFSQNNQQQYREGTLYADMTFYDLPGALSENKINDQQYGQSNRTRHYELNVAYTEPLKKGHVLDLGYTLNRSSGRSRRQTFNYDAATGKYDSEDTLTSNRFSNSNTQQTVALGYNYAGPKIQYQFGLSLLSGAQENSSDNRADISIRQQMTNWSPRASVFYRFAKQKNLRIQYSGKSLAPTTEMLQPLPDLSNPTLVKVGNPELKQQFQHRINISYQQSDNKTFTSLSAQAGADYAQNKIVPASVISATGIQQLMYVNLNGIFAVNGRFHYGFALNKTKNGGGAIALWAQYNRDISLVNGEENIRRNMIIGQLVNLNYRLQERLSGHLSATASYTHSRYLIGPNRRIGFLLQNYEAGATCSLPLRIHVSSDITVRINSRQANLPGRTITTWNMAVYRPLFRNSKGEIRFACFDLLNKNSSFNQRTGDNFIETRENGMLQRYFLVSLRYNFLIKRIPW